MFGRILKKKSPPFSGVDFDLKPCYFSVRTFFYSTASVVTFFLEPYWNASAFILVEFGSENITVKLCNHSVDSV